MPEALEAMFPGEGARHSLWDLFELDPTGRYGRPSDRGEVLSRLDAKTLKHLRGWDEAAARCGLVRLRGLWTDVSLCGWLLSMLPDEPLIPKGRDATLPLDGMAYTTSSGRALDLMIPIKLSIVRENPGCMSEGDLAKALDIPRTTLREVLKRMKEIEFSLERKFTTDELLYVVMGGRRPMGENS